MNYKSKILKGERVQLLVTPNSNTRLFDIMEFFNDFEIVIGDRTLIESLFTTKNKFKSVIILNFDVLISNFNQSRTLFNDLIELNDKTRFIIFTNNPFVIQSAEGFDVIINDKNNFRIERIKVGISYENILSTYFGFNKRFSVNVESKFEKFYELLEMKYKNDLNDADSNDFSNSVIDLNSTSEECLNIVSRELRQYKFI